MGCMVWAEDLLEEESGLDKRLLQLFDLLVTAQVYDLEQPRRMRPLLSS